MSTAINILRKTLIGYNPKLYASIRYFKHRGTFPNLQSPKNVSEFILSSIFSEEISKYAPYADKLTVRSYMKKWGFERYLPELYGVWKNAYEIEFEKLPDSFALKTNHGCGSHYLCPNRSKLNKHSAFTKIDRALHTDFGSLEPQYSKIEPKCYAEEYIADPQGQEIIDYKFMCFMGKPHCVLVCSERKSGTVHFKTYDLNWNQLNWIRKKRLSNVNFKKPKKFNEMTILVTEIAKKFKFVRVDLYSLSDGRIIFGELTFSPQGGFLSNFTNSSLKIMGNKGARECK